MYLDRRGFYQQLEHKQESKVLVYVTGDRPGAETQIHPEVMDYFVEHLDLIGKVKKISLFLYTRGGSTIAAWSIVNLIRQFCDEFEVIVPSKAHSAGTLICLGANSIVMTKQATLGPVDPSVVTPLNPQVPGAPVDAKVPVSVEAINGFIELAQQEMKIDNPENLTPVLMKLADAVHPLVLGEVFRAKSQIKMLARRLLEKQLSDSEKIDRIISFLVSESGSHDYTIDRREARDELGLNIIKPDDTLYAIIKSIMDDIRAELELNSRYDPNQLLANNNHVEVELRSGLIESYAGGSHVFITKGNLIKNPQTPQMPFTSIQFDKIFEGWKHEK